MSACDGSCCVVFPISVPYADLRERASEILDGAQLLDMLVPLAADEARERAARFRVTLTVDPAEREVFTCRHWDQDSRLCTIYSSRPDMCHRYPYGRDGGCEHGCECRGIARRDCCGDPGDCQCAA